MGLQQSEAFAYVRVMPFVRNRDSLTPGIVFFQEDDFLPSHNPVHHARLRRCHHYHLKSASREGLSGHDAICRHALTRPRKGGWAGRRRGRTRGTLSPCAIRASDRLAVLASIPPADRVGNGAKLLWPDRRAYRKPTCARASATAVAFKACWLSREQHSLNPRSSSICVSAGCLAITSCADGVTRVIGSSRPRMQHFRPCGGTAIVARSRFTAPAILNLPGSAACHRGTRAGTTSNDRRDRSSNRRNAKRVRGREAAA